MTADAAAGETASPPDPAVIESAANAMDLAAAPTAASTAVDSTAALASTAWQQ